MYNFQRTITTAAPGYAARKLSEGSWSRSKRILPYEEIPKVPMIPFLGSAWAYFPIIGKYSTAKLHKADSLKNRIYGDVVRERFGNFEMVSCYDTEGMSLIAEHEGQHPARSEFATLKAYRNQRSAWYPTSGVLISEGEEWQKKRDIVSKWMKEDFAAWYGPSLHDISREFVYVMRARKDGKKEVYNVMEYLYKWALESVAQVALDTKLDCLNLNLDANSDGMKMIDAIHTQLDCINKLEASIGNFPFWKYIPTPTWYKFKQAGDVFTAISHKCIINAIERHLHQPDLENKTLLQRLLGEGKQDFSSALVTIADIMFAGIDTTAHTAAFLLYNLAKNPEKQEKAYEEIMRLFPSKGFELNSSMLDEMKYAKLCLKESMRLTPTVRGNLRVFDHDVVLKGYNIPAGTAVLCVLQVIQKNEAYFREASKFIPERWEEEPLDKYSYQPFGYGKRSCLGERVAELEILTLVHEVLRNFRIEYHYKDMDMYTRLINTPDQLLRLRFHER